MSHSCCSRAERPPSPERPSLHLPSAPLDISTMLGKVSGESNQEAYTMASTPTRDLPEEFLAATRKSQETMIRAFRTWVETVRTVTPKLPSVPGPLADRLPKLPSVTAPFADRLPTPEDVVASGYDFAEQLLAIQRKFAEDVLAATEPLIPGHGKRAWQDATRTDAATAAAKQTATVAKQTATAAKQTATAAKTAVTGTVQAAEQAVVEVTPKLRVTAPAPKAQS